jgi:hypothetical protein
MTGTYSAHRVPEEGEERVIELDHVLVAVSDLDAAGRQFEARHGLASIAGGRHPGWGTGNRIVPLGDTYLELVASVDPDEAAESPFGRWIAAAPSGRPLGWAVRTRQLDAIAGRLGLAVTAGSRRREDGLELRWRLAGMEQAVGDPSLPFFIEWGEGTPLPGRLQADHRDGPLRLDQVQLVGDAHRLDNWLGAHNLPITVRAGTPAVSGVVLAGANGRLAIPGAG